MFFRQFWGNVLIMQTPRSDKHLGRRRSRLIQSHSKNKSPHSTPP
ncbi:hypothetical protein CKA32_003052 [Geitlerinema sp. FC II]|nr:hypothetical protein CKA32_003052 [Geitlerinema sp. FC II]